MASPLRRGRVAARQRAQATHKPAMGLSTGRVGGPRGERSRRSPFTRSATASGRSCLGTRFRGIIALSVRVYPADEQTLRRDPRDCQGHIFISSEVVYIHILEERYEAIGGHRAT